MRALLLFNPNATTTDDRVRDVIAAALSSEVDLDVQPTKQRGHATHLAAGAVHEGMDAVFSLGGDGTANEVLQALAGTKVRFGPIPGGGANVLARALGLPNDPVAATSMMLDILREGRDRTIGLGRAGPRFFAFNAGIGFDASVVRLVEQNPGLKRRFGDLAFVLLAVREWFTGQDRTDPAVHVALDGGPPRGPYPIAIVGKADPYTFLGTRPMRVTPDAQFGHGLDLAAVRRVATPSLLRIVAGVFTGGRHVRLPAVDYWRDLDEIVFTAPRPVPLMVDGDYAGEHTEITLTAVPEALHVVA